MEEFLNFVLRRLAAHPDEVFLSHAAVDGRDVFTAQARRTDLPRIIGKRGQTIHAIRSLLNAGAAKHGGRVQLVIPD
ncbi:MAG: KH domain-containing protein [Chthoniobacterales bacterium]|nr:KH domain-containing protein [Chthoniobacterales bacterium]